MKFQYYLQDPQFYAGNIDILNVTRDLNHKYFIKEGREKHGFIYIVNGSLANFFQNCDVESMRASKGDLLFIPKGTGYSGIYLEKKTNIKIIQFDLISGELPDYLSSPTKINLPYTYELVNAFFHPIENHMSCHSFYYLSCLYELLWRIDESCAVLPKKYKKLQPALLEIGESWKENKKVGYYAELCNMSESHFRKLFYDYTGASPIDYRNGIRLIHAKNKLQSGEYNVSEAAYESGFSNVSFFIRLYKKKYGHTPKNE